MGGEKELKKEERGAKVSADFLLADFWLPGEVIAIHGEPPDEAIELGDEYFYIPEGISHPYPPANGDDVPASLLLPALLRKIGKENLADNLVEVEGKLHLIRFLENHSSYIPTEVFTLTPLVRNGRIRLMVYFTHRYVLKDTLRTWIEMKGISRTKGIWVVIPHAIRVDRVIDLLDKKVVLEKGGEWDPDKARPFLSWEELPAGLRKKTLVTQAITPGEVIKKVKTFVDYAFSGSASAFDGYESGTLWRPRNLVFGGGLTGNYMQELFWAEKKFYRPLPRPAGFALLLPSDKENRPVSEFFSEIVETFLPELAEMGLPLRRLRVAGYDPTDPASLDQGLESALESKPDILLGMIVPTGTVGDHDPYFYAKRRLSEMGYPSQMIKVSTAKKFRDRYLSADDRKGLWEDDLFQGFWINTALKLGAIPWMIRDVGLDEGLIFGVSGDESFTAVAAFDSHMRFVGWGCFSGPFEPSLIEGWPASLMVFHIEEGNPELVERVSGLGDVSSVRPSPMSISPITRRARMLAGLYFKEPDEPDVYHIATENWAPYREFNLYQIRRASGSLSPRTHAEICFWAARAYLSSFPKGPFPATIHFARAIRSALNYGFIKPGERGETPRFL